MRKYYENLDDYNDRGPSSLLDGWKRFMQQLMAAAVIVMILACCAVLEAM